MKMADMYKSAAVCYMSGANMYMKTADMYKSAAVCYMSAANMYMKMICRLLKRQICQSKSAKMTHQPVRPCFNTHVGTVVIINGGYEVRAERKPSHIPAAPAKLEALTPDVTNAVKIEWKGEQSVRLYQVQMSITDPAVTPAWTMVTLTSKRQHTVPDLEPYRMYWFRIIAVNTAGESLPSDVLMARAA